MTTKINIKQIPKNIKEVSETLENKGFSAYLVGGCVRDLLLGHKPKDWDIATSAKPEEIIALFEKTYYENTFGTVTVVDEQLEDLSLRNIEITPYRSEGEYSDWRHPDQVKFSDNIKEDLSRRDFTVNAIAYRLKDNTLLDPHNGLVDIKDKVIRAVGEATERFNEDPLRMLRAIRLSTQLNFNIEDKTKQAIKEKAILISKISHERIRDELIKIIMSEQVMSGIELTRETGLLKEIMPELLDTWGVEQKGSHIYTVWEHTLRAVQHGADKNFSLEIRLAALFHDIGKPPSKNWDETKQETTFYGHEVIGTSLAKKIMERLRFPAKTSEQVLILVRNHMFFSDPDKISLSAVRRIVAKVGQELIWDLIKLRNCDRIGMGRPKESPYRLRKYQAMIEEALRAPTSVKMLKVSGETIMKITTEKPGPRIGYMLHALLDEVLETPEKNNLDYLTKRINQLKLIDDRELKKLSEKSKEKIEDIEHQEIGEIRKKHHVS